MKERLLIRDAAVRALRTLGRAGTIHEIHAEIVKEGMFKFDTPTPEHVLRTTIRRHTGNVERVDSSEQVLFLMLENEVYGLPAQNTSRASKMNAVTGIKRIHRATDKEEIIRTLTGDELGVFREIWRLLVFAAQVGYRNSRREPLKAVDSGKGIDQSTFGNSPAWPGVVYLMALADAGGAEVLRGSQDREEQRIGTFQEYANGGLAVLEEFFESRPVNLDGLIDFIDSQRTSRAGPPNLELSI